MKRKHKRRSILLCLCYGAVMLAWLLWCSGQWALGGYRRASGLPERRELAPADFATTTSGIAFSPNWERDRFFTTTDGDPQLHLNFAGGAHIERLALDMQPVNKPGGEMALYYTTSADQPFSEARKLPAMQNAQGEWTFDLQGKKVYALRLDPDSVGGVYWQVHSLVLNETKPPLAYYTPDALEVMGLLFGPLLLYAILAQILAFFQPVFAKRRLERRWQQPDAKPLPAKGKAKAAKDKPAAPKPTPEPPKPEPEKAEAQAAPVAEKSAEPAPAPEKPEDPAPPAKPESPAEPLEKEEPAESPPTTN